MYNFGVRQKWISRRVAEYEDNTKKNGDETEQKRSFFFNFITSNSIHALSCAIITHTTAPVVFVTNTAGAECVKRKNKVAEFFFAYCIRRRKKNSWYLCLEPLTLCLLTASVKKPGGRKKCFRCEREFLLKASSVSVIKLSSIGEAKSLNLSEICRTFFVDWYQVAVSCCCRYNHSYSVYGQPGVLDELLNLRDEFLSDGRDRTPHTDIIHP